MSMNISSNYGSYPPIINSSQLSDMKTALQVQEKIAETEKNTQLQTAIAASGAKGQIVDISIQSFCKNYRYPPKINRRVFLYPTVCPLPFLAVPLTQLYRRLPSALFFNSLIPLNHSTSYLSFTFLCIPPHLLSAFPSIRSSPSSLSRNQPSLPSHLRPLSVFTLISFAPNYFTFLPLSPAYPLSSFPFLLPIPRFQPSLTRPRFFHKKNA